MASLETDVRAEIKALHRFIVLWFRGEPPQTDKALDLGIARRLGESFLNIQPAGRMLSRRDLLDAMWHGYGTNEDFRIEIDGVDIRFHDPASGLVLATYLELQWGAQNSDPSHNARLSTVLLRQSDRGAFHWLHIHETATPTSR